MSREDMSQRPHDDVDLRIDVVGTSSPCHHHSPPLEPLEGEGSEGQLDHSMGAAIDFVGQRISGFAHGHVVGCWFCWVARLEVAVPGLFCCKRPSSHSATGPLDEQLQNREKLLP